MCERRPLPRKKRYAVAAVKYFRSAHNCREGEAIFAIMGVGERRPWLLIASGYRASLNVHDEKGKRAIVYWSQRPSNDWPVSKSWRLSAKPLAAGWFMDWHSSPWAEARHSYAGTPVSFICTRSRLTAYVCLQNEVFARSWMAIVLLMLCSPINVDVARSG